MGNYEGVMILGEIADKQLAACTREILNCGRRLADELKEELICVLFGDQIGEMAEGAIYCGADKVVTIEDPLVQNYQPEIYADVMEEIIENRKPRIFLMGQTDMGRDLAPRLAFRLRVGLCMDCIEMELDPEQGLLRQTRPVFGGNAWAVVVSKKSPQIATIRQKAMSAAEPDHSRTGEVHPFKPNIDQTKVRTKVLDTIKEDLPGIKLEDAQVVITGGRGIGSAEGFQILDQLANVFKGAVGGTRIPCDNDWISSTAQIGLTGKVVSPELYVAVGVSGACQHLAGCSGAKTIIAINHDPDANIFKVAQYGVVGDWKLVVPAFLERVNELLSP